MAFQVSPGVNVSEIDLTTIVPSTSTTEGGFVGQFSWGPVEDVELVSDELQLVREYGRPDNSNFVSFFTAANFLAYGDQLRLVRVVNESTETTSLTITTVGTAVTGTGFLTALEVGSTVTFGLETREIIAIADDTNATLDSAFTTDLTAEVVSVSTYVGALNATAEDGTGSGDPGVGILIKNEDVYNSSYSGGQADVGPFAAKFPGEFGNSLKVSICPSSAALEQRLFGTLATETITTVGTALTASAGIDLQTILEVGSIIVAPSGEEASVVSVDSATTATLDAGFTTDLTAVDAYSVKARWQYYSTLRFPIGTSSYTLARGGSNDEMHVVVVDEDGLFSGVAGQVLESFPLLSKASDAKKEDGASNYYKEAINRTSQYVWWTDHIPAGTNWGSTASSTPFVQLTRPYSYSLTGGDDGVSISDADKIRGYDLFSDVATIDISLVLGGEASQVVATHIINNICESRLDCVAVISPEKDDVVDNPGQEAEDIVEFRNTLPSSSYAVMDSGWKFQYDKYNDVFRWVPLNGDIAGLMVRTDEVQEPWFSPAGFNRGNIKNVVKLSYNPSRAERDDLYTSEINPVVSFSGRGTILYGDKTLLAKPSAFNRINVRRLFIILEKSISRAAQFSLFEFNDVQTRAQFKALINPFLEQIKSGRGITDFHVVCDTRNNTPEVIDRNEFVGDIYIKPARSINFIQLNFIAVRTGVEFNEIIGNT